MKKSSKVLSLVLAVLMAVSCFSGLTIFSASAEETDTKIYFDASNLPAEWGTTKTVYCHLYAVAGDDLPETSWQGKAEKCKKGRHPMDAVFSFLFGTRTGFAILFAGGILLFAILAFVMEKRTHKMYVDRGPKSEDEEDSFWD